MLFFLKIFLQLFAIKYYLKTGQWSSIQRVTHSLAIWQAFSAGIPIISKIYYDSFKNFSKIFVNLPIAIQFSLILWQLNIFQLPSIGVNFLRHTQQVIPVLRHFPFWKLKKKICIVISLKFIHRQIKVTKDKLLSKNKSLMFSRRRPSEQKSPNLQNGGFFGGFCANFEFGIQNLFKKCWL